MIMLYNVTMKTEQEIQTRMLKDAHDLPKQVKVD